MAYESRRVVIVRRADFEAAIRHYSQPGSYACDTETTGLKAYQGDQLFSLILSDGVVTHYFNFQEYPGLSPDWVLPRAWLGAFAIVFETPLSTWYMHNAKFDLSMLHREGLRVQGIIHCTQALGRVIKNNHLGGKPYSLASTARRLGFEKSEAVAEYIKEHKLFERVSIPGKKKLVDLPHFDRVPFDVMAPYGEKDGDVTWHVGRAQEQQLLELSAKTATNIKPVSQIEVNEKQLTKTCFQMEKVGIRINREFCKEALAYELSRAREAMESFARLTGIPFVDSNKVLAEAFTKMGEVYPKTEKGNPSFTDEILQSFTTPVAQVVREYRDANRRAGTYYSSFLYFADSHDDVHAVIRQDGTEPGRMSYADPNLQNLPKTDEDAPPEKFPVRRAFQPRPGYFFAMLDYDQMEYRLMLNYAARFGDRELIDLILRDGLDVHAATAQLMGVTRGRAKTINFGLLYGQGSAKLAKGLGVTLDEGKALRRRYFNAIPGVEMFIKQVMRAAETRGFVVNWAGRICNFSDPSFAYIAPNHLIQGGCADVVKIAMNRCAEYLRGRKSRLLVQIHDELLFEVHESEAVILPELKRIMEDVYPAKYLPLTCGIEHSFTSWEDKTAGVPA